MNMTRILENRIGKNRLGWLFAEAALIVLGVLLGMMANEWRVAWNNEHEAERALLAIRNELQTNFEQIEAILPYHRQIDDSLEILAQRIYTQNAKISPLEILRAIPKGFTTPLIEKNAWELLNRTGAISNIDFDLASALSKLYSQQAFYQSKLDIIGQNLYVAGNLNPENLASTAIALGLLANDIVIQEKRLVERYPQMMERLENYLEQEREIQ